jgi:hypothetical protein
MALEKTITTDFGLEIQNAYLRIEELSIIDMPILPNTETYQNSQSTRNSQITFSLRSYINSSQTKPINSVYFVCSYTLASEDNPIKQGYLYLKSLPEFENAVDV